MVFDHFPVFALKMGLRKSPEMDQKSCLEKIGFFCVFLLLFCRHFGFGKFSGKNVGKNGKSPKFNSELLFFGKMAEENVGESG